MRTMSSMHFSVCSPALRLHVCVIQPFVTRDYVWASPPRPPLTPRPSCSLRLAVGRPMGNNPLLRGPEPCCSPKPGQHACPAAGPQAHQRSTVAGWVAGKHRPRPMGKHQESRLVIGKRLQVPCPSVSAKQPPITPPSRSFQLPLSLVGRPVGPYSESESPAGVGGWSRGRHDGACMLDH